MPDDRKPKLKSGYAYRLQAQGCWRKASDDDWEIVMISPHTSKYLGWRRIDGVRLAVHETPQGIYAQTPL